MHYNRLVACRVLLIDYIKSSRHTFFKSIYNDKVISPILPFTLALYSLKIRNHPYILCNISSFLLFKSSEYLSSSTSQLTTVCTQRKICWSLPNKLLCDLTSKWVFSTCCAVTPDFSIYWSLTQIPLKPPIKCCQSYWQHTPRNSQITDNPQIIQASCFQLWVYANNKLYSHMKGTHCLNKALFYVLWQLTPLPDMCVKQLSVCLDREK